MRTRKAKDGLTVQVVAGTNAVLLGLSLDNGVRAGCMGFAIQRTDHTEDEKYWMRGMKVFEYTGTSVAPGQDVSSREHPFQSFQWSDFTAKPGHEYTYRVIPLYGDATDLREGDAVSVKVKTEVENDGVCGVYFNRGVCSSQAYARKFENKSPKEIGQPAWDWLSRGLVEGLLHFIERAENDSYTIHGAVYEFQHPTILAAIREAAERGVQIKVVVDLIEKKSGPWTKNLASIKSAQFGNELHVARSVGTIMHNKFLVLSRKGKPQAVWTGSTNWTENGLYGHSNCGHVTESPVIAASFLAYWHQLSGNHPNEVMRDWMDEHAPSPPDPWEDDEVCIFSPRNSLAVLDWYAQIAGSAKEALFMTFAFGMNERFLNLYEREDDVLKYALMEKEGNGKLLAQGKIDIRRVRARRNVIIAVANNLELNVLDRWVAERRSIKGQTNVTWIHTKYALIDPLSNHPIVITGSANFSVASTDKNDENMLVIRNNTRLADILLTEFLRLHGHYAFREAVKFSRDKGEDFEQSRAYLRPTDDWQKEHYIEGHDRSMRRKYFASVAA